MQLAEAANVIGVVITFEFSFTFSARVQRCKAAVPLATATAYFEPIYFAKLSSNSLTFGPCVRKSLLSVSVTAAISSADIYCFPYGITSGIFFVYRLIKNYYSNEVLTCCFTRFLM